LSGKKQISPLLSPPLEKFWKIPLCPPLEKNPATPMLHYLSKYVVSYQ